MKETVLNNLALKAYETAKEHGFWDNFPPMEHNLMLVLTEISEAVEAHRMSRTGLRLADYPTLFEKKCKVLPKKDAFESVIKGTINDEMADIAIRLLDLAGKRGMDFTKLTECRYFRAFDSFSFTENAFGLAKGLTRDNHSIERRIQFGLHYLQGWCNQLGIPLEWHIYAKMEYNKTREFLHGKRY